MASSLLQQGNNLHQTCFLAQIAFPLCQLQCVGWHIAEVRGWGERVEAEPWLHCLPALTGPSPWLPMAGWQPLVLVKRIGS